MSDVDAVERAVAEFFGEAPVCREQVGAIGVLVFEDEPDEEDDDEEPLLYFVSAGMSGRALACAPHGAELVLSVRAALDEEGVAALGELVGALAEAFVKHPNDVEPGALIEAGPLPIFSGMEFLFLSAWGDGAELDALTPPRSLFSLNPLSRDEVEALERAKPDDPLAWLTQQGVDVDDPLRLSRRAMEETWSAAEALSRGDSFAFAQAMEATAGRIRDLAARTLEQAETVDPKRRA